MPLARKLAVRFYRFWWGTGLADDAPALTYYLVLSLAPFALGLAALEAIALRRYVDATKVADQLNRFLPAAIHGDVTRLVTGTRSDSPRLLAIAMVSMLWTTSGAIGVVERCASRILDRGRHGLLIGRIRNMGLGLLVAVLVVAAAGSATVVNGADSAIGIGHVSKGIAIGLSALGSTLAFAIIYRTAPLARMSWASALAGALPAGIALQFVPTLVGFYLHAAGGLQAVRLFLVLAVILLGLYAMAVIILGGAGLAALRERERRPARPADEPQPPAS